MSNMTELYQVVSKFCDLRRQERRKFLQRREELESAKGSRYYDDEIKKAREQRQAVLSAARREAQSAADVILARMMDKAEALQLEPLTPEQMSVVQYLQMRKTLTDAEVTMAANSLKESGLGLQLLRELAQDRGVQHPFISMKDVKSGMTIETARQEVANLARFCSSVFADLDGANTIRRMTAKWHSNVYGGSIDFDPDELPEEATFTSEQDFYKKALDVTYEAFARFAD